MYYYLNVPKVKKAVTLLEFDLLFNEQNQAKAIGPFVKKTHFIIKTIFLNFWICSTLIWF